MEQETMRLWNTPEIKKAYKELDNSKFRMEYEFRLKYLNDRVWELSESHEKGREEGVTKGHTKGHTKGLKEGVDLGKELVQKEKARLALSLSKTGWTKRRAPLKLGFIWKNLKTFYCGRGQILQTLRVLDQLTR